MVNLEPVLAPWGGFTFTHRLQAALQADLPTQRLLLQICLHLVEAVPLKMPGEGAPTTQLVYGMAGPVGTRLLLCRSLAPALQEHVCSPAGLRTLQAVASQLRTAVAAAPGSEECDDEEEPEGEPDAADVKAARQCAVLRLLAGCSAIAMAAGQQPGGQQRQAVAARTWADALPHAAQAAANWCSVLGAADVDTEFLSSHMQLAGPAVDAAFAAARAVSPAAYLSRGGAAATCDCITAALRLLRQLDSVDRQPVDSYCLALAAYAKQQCLQGDQQPSGAGAPTASAAAAAAASGRAKLLKALWRAHGACASQLIEAADGGDAWQLLGPNAEAEATGPDAELCRTSGLPIGRPLAAALAALWDGAVAVWAQEEAAGLPLSDTQR